MQVVPAWHPATPCERGLVWGSWSLGSVGPAPHHGEGRTTRTGTYGQRRDKVSYCCPLRACRERRIPAHPPQCDAPFAHEPWRLLRVFHPHRDGRALPPPCSSCCCLCAAPTGACCPSTPQVRRSEAIRHELRELLHSAAEVRACTARCCLRRGALLPWRRRELKGAKRPALLRCVCLGLMSTGSA